MPTIGTREAFEASTRTIDADHEGPFRTGRDSLGQEFGGYAMMVRDSRAGLEQVRPALRTISLGATAIGTGIAADPRYAEAARRHLSEITGIDLRTATDLVGTTSDMGPYMELSGPLNRFAMLLSKVCDDLRLLSSGPQAGFGDICLPERQAGSSIMPGKVNPAISPRRCSRRARASPT